MKEEDARLALLLAELNALQNHLRDSDTRIFQIKGWCVTTAVAIGGFAVAYHQPALLAVGAGAVISFFLVNCQFRYYWRLIDKRNRALDDYLKRTGISGCRCSGGRSTRERQDEVDTDSKHYVVRGCGAGRVSYGPVEAIHQG